MRAFPSFRTYTAMSVLRGDAARRRERVVGGDIGRRAFDDSRVMDLCSHARTAAVAVGGRALAVADRHRSEGFDLRSVQAPVKIVGLWHARSPSGGDAGDLSSV